MPRQLQGCVWRLLQAPHYGEAHHPLCRWGRPCDPCTALHILRVMRPVPALCGRDYSSGKHVLSAAHLLPLPQSLPSTQQAALLQPIPPGWQNSTAAGCALASTLHSAAIWSTRTVGAASPKGMTKVGCVRNHMVPLGAEHTAAKPGRPLRSSPCPNNVCVCVHACVRPGARRSATSSTLRPPGRPCSTPRTGRSGRRA